MPSSSSSAFGEEYEEGTAGQADVVAGDSLRQVRAVQQEVKDEPEEEE